MVPFGCSTFGRFQPNWFCYKWRLLRSAFPQLLPPWLVLVKNPMMLGMVELFNVTNIIISRGAFRGPSIQPNPIIQIRSHFTAFEHSSMHLQKIKPPKFSLSFSSCFCLRWSFSFHYSCVVPTKCLSRWPKLRPVPELPGPPHRQYRHK